MPWPVSQDYNEAVQNPGSCFGDPELRQGEPVLNALGLPMPRSGNFADVYEVVTPATKRKWAVKCFTREVPGLRERYREISEYLRQANLPFMVDFNYLDEGIRIRGQWYPILKMHWVEGLTLNEFVKSSVDKPQTLELLLQIWARLARRLHEARMAHCDLQHGNVLLVPGSKANSLGVKLIDYDGMCVPALVERKSGEVGHPAFQHPQRIREGLYGLQVDRFPHLVIYCALNALIRGGRGLWDRFDNGDNLLFRQNDLEDPAKSPVFQELIRSGDSSVRALAVTLMRAVRQPLEQVPLLKDLPSAGLATTSRRRDKQPKAAASEATASVQQEMFAAFGNVESQALAPRQPKKKGERRLWALAGVGFALFLVSAGITLMLTRKGHEAPKPEVTVAQTQPGASITPAPTNPGAPKPSPKPNPAPPVPVTPDPTPEPVKPKAEPDPSAAFALTPAARARAKPVRIKTKTAGGDPARLGEGLFEDSSRLQGYGLQQAISNSQPAAENEDLLTGLGYHLATDADGKTFLKTIRPVYWTTAGQKALRTYGQPMGPELQLIAREGYAIGTVTVRGAGRVEGLKVVFMRIQGDMLDARDSYEASWVGGGSGQPEVALAGDGKPVIGIYGRCTDGLDRLGLVQLDKKIPKPGFDESKAVRASLGVAIGSKSAADLKAEAAQLLQRGMATTDDVILRHACLDIAWQKASHAVDVTLAFRAIDALAQDYAVNPLLLKSSVYFRASNALRARAADGTAGAEYSALQASLVLLVEQALAQQDLNATRNCLYAGRQLAQVFKDEAQVTNLNTRASEVGKVQQAFRTGQAVVQPPPRLDPKPQPVVEKLLPVPDEAAQARAEAAIKETYKAEYLKRKPAEMAALASQLLQSARTKNDPVERFVMLREARDLAAQGIDPVAAFKAIDQLAERYIVDAAEMKSAVLARAGQAAFLAAQGKVVLDAGFALVDEAVAADNYERAFQLLTTADEAIRKVNSPQLSGLVKARRESVNDLQKEFQQIQPAQEALKKNPADAEANLAVGKYVCCSKGLWEKGLPMLAASSDAALKALAAKDLANPTEMAAQVELADGWWQRAEAASGNVKTQLYRHAYHWYDRALPDLKGPALARVDKRIKYLEALPGVRPPEMVGQLRQLEGHMDQVLCVAVSPDGHRALSGGMDRSVRLWDLETGKQIRQLIGVNGIVRHVGFDPDGKRVFASGGNGILVAWDAEGKLESSHGTTGASSGHAALLPGGRIFTDRGNNLVEMWTLPGGSNQYSAPWGEITAMAASSDGRGVLIGTADGLARIWDVLNKRESVRLAGHTTRVSDAALSSDARWALTGSTDKTARVWDVLSKREIHRFRHAGAVSCVALSADGRRALTAEDKVVRLWDVKGNKELMHFDGHEGPVHSVAFSQDGRRAVSGSGDRTVRLWALPR